MSLLVSPLEGQFDLIAVDPPFATGRTFLSGETFAYHDDAPQWEYLQWLRDTFELSRRLLKPTGNLCVHLDTRAAAQARLLLDEVFGPDRFVNEIIWAYSSGGRSRNSFPAKHDAILVYARGEAPFFDGTQVGIVRGDVRRNHMKRETDEDGRTYRTIRSAGKLYRYYDDETVLPTDVWTDLAHLQQRDPERTGYPTQKPERLLERLIRSLCPTGGLVLDYCCGSGTAAVVATRTGRTWIAIDVGDLAIETTTRRLRAMEPAVAFVVETLEPDAAIINSSQPEEPAR